MFLKEVNFVNISFRWKMKVNKRLKKKNHNRSLNNNQKYEFSESEFSSIYYYFEGLSQTKAIQVEKFIFLINTELILK